MMSRNDKRTSKRNKSNGRASSSRNGKSKEFEVNLKDSQVNPVDLRVITKKGRANNDVSWYNKLKQLYEDAVAVNFNQNVGLPYTPFKSIPQEGDSVWSPAYTAPGVMRIWLAPVVGKAVSNNDPINLAAQNLYVRVTSKNNRDGKYDRTDLMMMIYAVDSAYMLYEFLNRVYCGFKNISDTNRYYPLPLLSIMQANVQDLQDSLDQLRSLLNTFAYRLASINVPDVFSFISRHSWLFSHVYKDSESEKAQAYVYMPDGFYVWREGVGSGPNYLEYIQFEALFQISEGHSTFGIEAIKNAINTIMTPLVGSSYVGLMSSDIAMAFSDSDLIKISEITDQASLEPVYDELVLMQMSNCTLVKHLDRKTLNVTQIMSNLVAGPYLYQLPQAENNIDNSHVSQLKKYLNLRKVSGDAVAEATRLMCTGMVVENDGVNVLQITESGTEIVTSIDTNRFSFPNGVYAEPTNLRQQFFQNLMSYTATSSALLSEVVTSVVGNMELLVTNSAFDWAPTIYMWLYDLDTQNSTYLGVMQDLDNYVYLTDLQLNLLHNAIVLSEFKVD